MLFRSFKPFGTTHELLGTVEGDETPTPYADVGTNSTATCPAAPNWLYYAKHTAGHTSKDTDTGKETWDHGTYWDSNSLKSTVHNLPAAQFVHGFINGGMAAITRANDPFWNVRAFDSALANHGGYKLSSFICALNQLVLDDIAAKPPPPPTPQ